MFHLVCLSCVCVVCMCKCLYHVVINDNHDHKLNQMENFFLNPLATFFVIITKKKNPETKYIFFFG